MLHQLYSQIEPPHEGAENPEWPVPSYCALPAGRTSLHLIDIGDNRKRSFNPQGL
jgi:hypothetical protein